MVVTKEYVLGWASLWFFVLHPAIPQAQSLESHVLETPEEMQEVQNELGDADVPLTSRQWLELIESENSNTSGRGKPSAPVFSGFLGWRHQWSSANGIARTGRVNLKGKGGHLKLRQVKRQLEVAETGGFIVYEKSQLAVGVGGFGVNHGFGILKAGPGRGAYLAADSRFAMKRQGVRKWAGGYDHRVIQGGMIHWNRGDKWEALVVVGSAQKTERSILHTPQEKMARIGGKMKGVKWGVLATVSDAGWGLSHAGETQAKGLRTSWEVAGWRIGEDGQLPALAWAMAVGLDPKKNWVLEAMAVATDGTDFFSGGKLPYLAAGEGGRGWFLRSGRKIPSVGHLLFVAGKMNHRTASGTGQRHHSTIFDIQGRWLPRPGIEMTGRWRRRQRQIETWSSVYPWQVPYVASQELRSVVTGQVNFKFYPLITRVMGRLYQQGKDASWGTRSMVTFSALYWLGPSTAIQGSNTTAWGDPVDLVSAISPMAGLVLPRHWGGWREETTVGIRFVWKFLQGRWGFSRRVPENWNDQAINFSVWGEGSIRW